MTYRFYSRRQRYLTLSGCYLDEVISFRRSRRSQLEINSEEKEALKDVVYPTSYVNPSDSQRELVDLSELVMMIRDVFVIRERPS